MCIEKEKTKMNPPVLGWNWKLWTPSFIDIDIEINKHMDLSGSKRARQWHPNGREHPSNLSYIPK